MALLTPVDRSVQLAANRLQGRYAARDMRMQHIRLVREGHIEMLFPDQFSDDWPRAITANYIDSAARDVAEAIATMPKLICGTGRDDAKARAYAAKKSKAGAAYWKESKLAKQLITAADCYVTYGFQPILVEVDYDRKMPLLRFEDPTWSYPEFDRWGCVVRYVKVFETYRTQLVNLFPEFERQLMSDEYGRPVDDGYIRMIRYMDKERTVLYVPSLANGVLMDEPNPIGRCPVAIAARPGLNADLRGQFDDIIWIQIARNRLALLRMQAAQDAVEAPLAVPDDVQELALGPYALMRSREPQGIRRVGLEVPQSVFIEDQTLNEELRVGSRQSGIRGGAVNANVITGRGVQALDAGFDTQIQSAHTQIGEALAEATSIAFELDDKLFGNIERKMAGVENGSPYEINWKPSRDLKGDYSCEVSYGFYAGQSLPQAIVTLLQLRGDRDLSRTTLMKNIPYDIDVEEELRNIDVEDLREVLKNAVASVSGSIPQFIAGGGDPTAVLQGIAKFIELRGKGILPEDAIQEAFQPAQQPEETNEPTGPEEPDGGAGQGGQGPAAPLNPGESQFRPDMMQLMASLRNGKPSMNSNLRTSRQV